MYNLLINYFSVMDNENVSVDQDGGEADVDQSIDTVAIDLEPEKPKEYPRIKIS